MDKTVVSLPLLTIVIANYNYGRFLRSAIESVITQSCQDFELILVDGGSTDGSLEIIKEYAGRLGGARFNESNPIDLISRVQPVVVSEETSPRFLWCSEKDRGQSHAFNKGFSRARGRFLTWLNADDLLLPGAIEALRKHVTRYPDAQWIGGGTVWMDAQLCVVKCSMCLRFRPFIFRYLPGWLVGGPSSFFSRELFQTVGGFRESLHYMMDIDMWFRLLRMGTQLQYLSRYVWGFRLHEASKTTENFFASASDAFKDEGTRLMAEYQPNASLVFLGQLYLRICKVCDGSLLRSGMDTLRLKGKVFHV